MSPNVFIPGNKIPFLFIIAAVFCLLTGISIGILGGLQYVLPEFLKDALPFSHIRPLHVSLVITWIFTAATGGIYYYMQIVSEKKIWSMKLAQIHFILFLITGTGILICFFSGWFGGREYYEFPPALSIPMFISWLLFAINFFKTFRPKFSTAPVYIWMWSTGIIFFCFTFIEQYLWNIPWFRDNLIRDITIQWKSLGAIVGSWNQLVYGTAFYIMEKISGNTNLARSRTTFFFYFLGLTNLMFNWGHHTYIVPAAPYIKTIAYVISMTELLILGSIMLAWRESLGKARRNFHLVPYRFLSASDIWIFLNLILAIAMSVPLINNYTHGTHITVAHAMGATIGINTMILLSSIFFIAEDQKFTIANKFQRSGFWITNISLFVFWLSLIGAGIVKAAQSGMKTPFSVMMEKLTPWFHAFTLAGFGIFTGIFLITYPLLGFLYKKIFSRNERPSLLVAEASKKRADEIQPASKPDYTKNLTLFRRR